MCVFVVYAVTQVCAEGFSVVYCGHMLVSSGSQRLFSGVKVGVLCVSVHSFVGLNEYFSQFQLDLLLIGVC